MSLLIEAIILIYSLMPTFLILRLFFVRKGGRDREPNTGRFVNRDYVKAIILCITFLSSVVIKPLISDPIYSFCLNKPVNEDLLIVIGLILYFFMFK